MIQIKKKVNKYLRDSFNNFPKILFCCQKLVIIFEIQRYRINLIFFVSKLQWIGSNEIIKEKIKFKFKEKDYDIKIKKNLFVYVKKKYTLLVFYHLLYNEKKSWKNMYFFKLIFIFFL